MLCPLCKVVLAQTNRQDITIDYCPQCRGVWLDRGELEKIIERSVAYAGQPTNPNSYGQFMPQPGYNQPYPPAHQQPYPPQPGYGHYDDDDYYKHNPHHRRKSVWGDIFDFD